MCNRFLPVGMDEKNKSLLLGIKLSFQNHLNSSTYDWFGHNFLDAFFGTRLLLFAANFVASQMLSVQLMFYRDAAHNARYNPIHVNASIMNFSMRTCLEKPKASIAPIRCWHFLDPLLLVGRSIRCAWQRIICRFFITFIDRD